MVLNTAERILTWRCVPRILIPSFPPGTKTDTAVSSPESQPAVSVRQGNPYIGAAPGADIVVVKLKECKQYLRSFYLVPEGVPAYQGK